METTLKTLPAVLLAALFAAAAVAAPPAPPKPQDVRFAPGSSGTELKGTIKGDKASYYRLVAGAGQTLSVAMKASNGGQSFNIVSPGSNEAMFIGETQGEKAQVVLPTDGAFLIQTFLVRSAARRNESSNYTLQVSVTGTPLAALPGAQDAKIPGTRYHAKAPLRCNPPYASAEAQCEAGVIRRGRDGTATVEIRGPNQLFRQIMFAKGQPVASNSAQPMSAKRAGDTTIVDFRGEERYDIPDALLTGG
jgi:hypothetical protein